MLASNKTKNRRVVARTRLIGAALAAALSPLVLAQPLQPLTFAEALALAQRESPGLAAQRHALGAAEAAVVPASQLPDPKLVLGIDNLPVNGPDRWGLTQDFMTMRRIGVMQDFPREEKLKLKGERAQAEAAKERAVLFAASVRVKRDLALAWLDAHLAQAKVQTLTELVPEAELLNEVSRALLAGGKVGAADPIAARGAAVALQDRIAEAGRDLKRAQAALARWVGPTEATRPLAAPPDLTVLAQAPDQLLAGIEHHPELAAYRPAEAMARAEAELARAAKKPDWSLELAYQQRGPAFSNMLSVAVRIDLPLWGEKRQDPLIVARQKQIEQVQASREDARRMHEAEIRGDLAAWETARDRLTRVEQQLLPLARERTQATLAAYRGGRDDLTAVLQARGNEIETRLMLVQQRAELARAWANLNFLLDAHMESDTK
jgi:outer membrane protein TolC